MNAEERARFTQLVELGYLPETARSTVEKETKEKKREEEEKKRQEEKEKKQEEKRKRDEYRPEGKKKSRGLTEEITTGTGNFLGKGIGLVGGLFISKYVGKYLEEKLINVNIPIIPSQTKGWGINNGTKILTYTLIGTIKKYRKKEEGLENGLMTGFQASLQTSVAIDTYERLTKKKLLNMNSKSNARLADSYVDNWIPLTDNQLENIQDLIQN